MKKIIVGAATVLALAGCGTAATSATHSPPPPSTASSPASAAPASPASQAAPGGLPVAQTVREGQPFTVTYDFSTGGSASWKLTLDSVAEGNGTMFDPKIMGDFYSSEGMPTLVPQADPGQQFALVKFTVTNEGDSNQPWSPSTVNVGQRAYTDTGGDQPSGYSIGTASDAEGAYNNWSQHHGTPAATFGLQPGTSGVSWSVFEVPSGAKVTSVSVEATAYTAGAQVVVTVPAPAKTVTMPAESSQPQPSASSAPQPSTSFQGDPTAGSGTGPACTTIAGYFPGGLPGHEDATGFCVPDK